jgi:hypothetical protein
MKKKNLLSAFVIFLFIFSCKKEEIKVDNIYKFKKYVSYTTSGVVSTTEKITVNLAQDVAEWEVDQEITADFITIKPFVNGKIKTINKHVFVFIPDERLDSDTEYTVLIKLNEIYKEIGQDYA